jgi:hypothetical protein
MEALDDAIEAGGKNSMKCTVILAEGASAKLFVVSISTLSLLSLHLFSRCSALYWSNNSKMLVVRCSTNVDGMA